MIQGLIGRLWRAQRGLCFHCGMLMMRHCTEPSVEDRRWSREHVFPRSTSGKGLLNNVVLAHRGCNSARGNREPTPAEIQRAREIYAVLGEAAFLGFVAVEESCWVDPPKNCIASLADLWPEVAR